MFGVVGTEKFAVGDHAGGVVEEGNEEDLDWFAMVIKAQRGAVEGVALPKVVGVGFGEGEAALGEVAGVGFEKVVFVDSSAEGVGCDLVTAKVALFDAGAIEGLDVEGTFGFSERRESFFDGSEKVFRGDLAHGAFVESGWRVSNAVSPIVIPPGLNGAPGEVVERQLELAPDDN